MSKRIGIVGTGYVGLITGVGLADFGNRVICTDIDRDKIDALKKGKVPIYEPGLKELLDKNFREKRISFTTDVNKVIQESEVIFIAVGTPSKENGEADLSYVKAAVESISQNMTDYKVIVTKSTVPVGTNRWIKEMLKKKTEKDDFDVVSNPEFLREGKGIYDFFHPDRVVIGAESQVAVDIMKDIYSSLYLIETPFVFCNWETAELIKYASNAFLATKITFINQIANLCEEIGADVHKVAKAMGMDGRISPKFLHPGPGFGGSCFPKDTKALVEMGKKHEVDMSLVREVIRSNENQKKRMVVKLEKKIGNLKNKNIGILGLAFKSETDDVRESPAITIVNDLLKEGARIKVHDPKAIRNFKRIFGDSISYYENEYEVAKNADALMILTEWNQYRGLDLGVVKKSMRGKIILDARNLLDKEIMGKYGFEYEGVGR